MALPEPDRTAALAIRLWVESTSPLEVRARIIATLDVSGKDEVSTTVATTEEIESAVREWLREFVDSVS